MRRAPYGVSITWSSPITDSRISASRAVWEVGGRELIDPRYRRPGSPDQHHRRPAPGQDRVERGRGLGLEEGDGARGLPAAEELLPLVVAGVPRVVLEVGRRDPSELGPHDVVAQCTLER